MFVVNPFVYFVKVGVVILFLVGILQDPSPSSTSSSWTSSFSFVLVQPVSAYDNGLGLTPPMGWNSWNQFGCEGLNEDLVQDIAHAMIETGLYDMGYRYINLDDCWQTKRNSSGFIQEDITKFPNGIAKLAETIHSMGLLFGLYSDAGIKTCAGRPGGYGYEQNDVMMYDEWKVDYLKYDNCYNLGINLHQRYQRMHDALNSTASGRPIYFSLCEWGDDNPATWARSIGNSWRTTQDISPSWESMMKLTDINNQWWEYAGPGGWNDPDMLEVGNGDWTLQEQRTHFTLWCLMKSPLLLGNDLRNIPDDIMAIISNTEVIAWNQDPLGKQGYRRSQHKVVMTKDQEEIESSSSLLEVWAGDLVDGKIALVLLNRSDKEHTITATWTEDLNILDENKKMSIRDVWMHTDIGIYQQSFTSLVPPHGVMAVELSPWKNDDDDDDNVVPTLIE